MMVVSFADDFDVICGSDGRYNETLGRCVCSHPNIGGHICNLFRCDNGGKLVDNYCVCTEGFLGRFCDILLKAMCKFGQLVEEKCEYENSILPNIRKYKIF